MATAISDVLHGFHCIEIVIKNAVLDVRGEQLLNISSIIKPGGRDDDLLDASVCIQIDYRGDAAGCALVGAGYLAYRPHVYLPAGLPPDFPLT